VRSSFTEGQDFGVLGAETWRLAYLGAKHALLLAGSGWGLMPEPVVRDDLASARLVRLDLPEAQGGLYPSVDDLPYRQPARSCRGMEDPALCDPSKVKSLADVCRKRGNIDLSRASWPFRVLTIR
jgi:hypothetical protein